MVATCRQDRYHALLISGFVEHSHQGMLIGIDGEHRVAVNGLTFGSVPVVLPKHTVLSAFEALVAVTEEQRSRNTSMAQTLATLRDTLLPRLISGALRLPEAQDAAAEVALA